MTYKITQGSHWLPKKQTFGYPCNYLICYLRKSSQLQGRSPQHAVLTVSTCLNLEILGIEELIIVI